RRKSRSSPRSFEFYSNMGKTRTIPAKGNFLPGASLASWFERDFAGGSRKGPVRDRKRMASDVVSDQGNVLVLTGSGPAPLPERGILLQAGKRPGRRDRRHSHRRQRSGPLSDGAVPGKAGCLPEGLGNLRGARPSGP